MQVLLIAPPLNRFGGRDWNTFHLGLGYLAAVLRNEGHRVLIYDANVNSDSGASACSPNRLRERFEAGLRDDEHPVWKEAKAVIRDTRPDVVGITCRVPDMMAATKIAQIVKSIDEKCVTVMGGPAATTCTDLILQESCVDFVVRGEGEITMVELLRLLAVTRPDFSKVDGLSFRGQDGAIHNRSRALIRNIDTLPFPARDLLMFADRLTKKTRLSLMGHLITSRGCPYLCTYCANHAVWGTRRVRMRSPDSVVAEVLHLRDVYGVKRVIFWDDHLTTRRDRVVTFCNLLIEKKANVQWLSFVRADTIDAELLQLMKRAGCYELQMGVESGSERILKKIRKGVTLDQIRKTAKLLRESGLRWHAFLMIGFPGETLVEMEATMQLLSELYPDSAELSVVSPYPGTELFENAIREGQLDPSGWQAADTCRPESVLVDTMSRDAFRDLALRYMKECDAFNASRTPWHRRAARAVRKRIHRTWGQMGR